MWRVVCVCVTKREGCEKFLRLRGRSFVFIWTYNTKEPEVLTYK